MSRRSLGLAALLAAAALFAIVWSWSGLRSSGTSQRSTDETRTGPPVGSPTTSSPTSAPGATGERGEPRPRVPPFPRVPPKPIPLPTTAAGDVPMWDAFAAEPRDDRWADEHEALILDRVRQPLEAANRGAPGSVAVRDVECRSRHCRFVVTGGDATRFQAFVEQLQDERGFYGRAAGLALDGYGTTVDKDAGATTRQVRIHLRF